MKFIVMLVFFGFNVSYMVSMFVLCFLGNFPRKNLIKILLEKFHVYCFQIYNWAIFIPSTHLSSYMIFADSCSVSCKSFGILNIVLMIIITNFIEYSRININFKCEDALDSRVDIFDRILLNYKFLVVFFAGVNFYFDYWMILLYSLLVVDYLRKVSFHIEKISLIYLSTIICFFFAHLVYFTTYTNVIDLNDVDLSYLLFFGCSIIIKTSIRARGYLLVHKLKLIAKYGLKSKLDFDLYIRETYLNLKNFRFNLDSKVLFLSFFSIHQNKCVLKDCACKLVKNNNEASFLKNKKTFKSVIESYFLEYLMKVKPADFEEVFLMYCSFINSILKIPSKSLNLLLTNKSRITSLKNTILIEILMKKSQKSLEKKLLNNDQYAQSFSTVILFDHQVRILESSIRKIIMNELTIGKLLINDNDFQNTSMDKFFDLGKNVNKNIENSKELIKKLFDKNVNNVRLIQMTTLIIKYLSEDMSFRNFYKQLNIKRINQQILKRKKGQDIDIFENEAGVIFISLNKDLGLIKNFSKNMTKVFGCDSNEMKNKNINEFMPLVFGLSHNEILNNFVKTGKAMLLVSGQTQLYGLTKMNFLMHLNIIIRLDTFFTKDFMIGAYIKSMKNTMSKTILLDIHGNFINCSKEIANFLNFTKLTAEIQHKISMILLIPDILEKLLPFNYQEILLKRNTDFKMKGFLLAPNEIDEKNIPAISIKNRIYSSFKEFQELEDCQKKFQELRNEVSLKLSQIAPQNFRFYRIHFTLIVQNFSNNFVNVRLIEIYDIFEIKDLKLQTQYLSRKNRKIREMLKLETHSPISNSFVDINKLEIKKKSIEGITVTDHNKNFLSVVEKEEDHIESYVSVTNREEIDQKLKNLAETISLKQTEPMNKDLLNWKSDLINLNSDLLNFKSDFLEKPDFPSKSIDLLAVKRDSLIKKGLSGEISQNSYEEEEKNSEKMPSSDQNLLPKPSEDHLKPSLSTIEQEESEISVERDEQDFEEKISLMSNNIINADSTEGETLNEEATHTLGASQISRISSHASGDGNKSTIDVLNKVGIRKIFMLKVLNIVLFLVFFIVTITFFMLIRNETFNLETTLKNSGLFHNQLSPLCILIRDSTIFKFVYSGILNFTNGEEKTLLSEIKTSIIFNNLILLRAYKSGIAQADSSVDFIYDTYMNMTIENVTLYTILSENSNNSLIKHQVPIKLLKDNLITIRLNIPQSILFFVSAAEHLYYVEILNDVKNATDSYNYIFFLNENILIFIKNMLEVLETNKEKIGGSVAYLEKLNLTFFLIVLFSILYGVAHSSYITIKSKFKANKFTALFFHFQENEIDERSNKLRHILDRYFDRGNLFNTTNFSNFSLNKTDISSKAKGDIISTDKIQLLRSELNSTKKVKHRHFKRSNSIKQIKGKKFQQFLIIFFIFGFNVTEIIGDLESVESYVITLHIQYAVNSMLMGLYEETPERKLKKMTDADELLKIVNNMQSQITDLTILFKVTNSDRVLTQLKYEFFTKDICELYRFIQENIEDQVYEVKEIADRLQSMDFCQKLLKNILTKGSTSFAFEINEIFKQWKDYIRNSDFREIDLISIIKTKEFIDINYALPYIYALGIYDITLMMATAEKYFESVRIERLIWFIFTLIAVTTIFSVPFQKLTKHLNDYTENAFSLIKIFPYAMISNNKMLENKIIRITKQQKI